MATMLDYKGRLYRINPAKPRELQYSTNKGLFWHIWCIANSSMGDFQELMDGGDEILARCEKGLFYSKTGQSFHLRSR